MELQSFSHLGGEVSHLRKYAVKGSSLWSCFNPSIQRDSNGDYWVAFRSSNYYFMHDRSVGLTFGSRVKNRLFLGKLNPITMLFEESTLKEIDTSRLNLEIKRGLEDPRLFFNGKHWSISCTVLEPEVPIAKIAVIQLKSLDDPEITSFEVLPSPDSSRIEKNWMPIHKTGKLAKSKIDFIYDSSTVISKGEFKPVTLKQGTEKFRGGSQVISIGDGTNLAIIHETQDDIKEVFSSNTFSKAKRNFRTYNHRFVRYNEDMEIIQISEPFYFIEKGIEFAAGLSQTNDGFAISFAIRDAESYIATIDLGHALLALRDV